MIYDNTMVKDTLEALMKDPVTGKYYFFGITTNAALSQSISEEKLRGGIGNKIQALMLSDKEISFTIQNLFNSDNFIAFQSGAAFESKSYTVPETETLKAVDNAGDIQITLVGSPDGTVTVLDRNNNTLTATLSGQVVTITAGEKDKYYTAVYTETSTVEVLDLNAEKFPSNMHVTLHGIAYDKDTQAKVADFYWDFPEAAADGALDNAYSNANTNQSIKFTATAQENGSYGSYVIKSVA